MYLSELDIIGLTIALVSALALIITSASANARLTRDRDFWRGEAIHLDSEVSRLNGIIDSLAPNDLHAVFTNQD